MTDQPRFIRVFLSSPGDVADERGIARKVIEDAAGQAPFRDQLMVKIIAWDNLSSRTPMLATLTPQEAINRRLPKPSDCDIVVVLFWSRMGTQLPHPEYQKSNGDPYYSGTEWEYLDAAQGARTHSHGLPLVVVYRRTEKKLLTVDDPKFDEKRQQYQRVEEFFSQFTNPDGSIGGGYNSYETPDKFRQLFEIDIRELLDTVLRIPTDDAPKQEKPVKLATQEQLENERLRNHQEEEALQTYLDRMQELLLEKGLLEATEDSTVAQVARTMTQVTFRRLSPEHKSTILGFLVTSQLVQQCDGKRRVLSLAGTDLEGLGAPLGVGLLDLVGADLQGANLQGAMLDFPNFQNADLRMTTFEGARVLKADFRGANLETAVLAGANLWGAICDEETILPNGKSWSGSDLTEFRAVCEPPYTEQELEEIRRELGLEKN